MTRSTDMMCMSRLLIRLSDEVLCSTILEDLRERFDRSRAEKGPIAASILHSFRCFIVLLPLFFDHILGGFAMFKNYLKITFRNLFSSKLFSFINIFGLAIGIAACIIISLWVQREISYDRFHENADRIFRIERTLFRDNLYSRWPITGGLYKQALIDDFPEIKTATRFWRRSFSVTDHTNMVHRQRLFAVDNDIFDIFDFNLESGDESTALTQPMSIVLTKENALKYLGTVDAVGKSIVFEWNGEPTDFKVTGILQDIPENSHIKFDMLMSINSYPDERFQGWRGNYLYTYVLLQENVSPDILNEKLKSFVEQRLEPVYDDLLVHGHNIHEVLKMRVYPITDIHLHPSENWELEAGGSIASVYIFSTIAILILVIACINFMNLSTARANRRAREVGLRKTVGAHKGQLRTQFLQESMLTALIALVIAVVLVSLSLPLFNSIFSETLTFALLFQAKNLLLLAGITLIVGLIAGLYPAFYLTRFDPASVLKGGTHARTAKSSFRRNTVVIQFGVTMILIIGMFTVIHQMNFIQSRPLGFDRENMVLLPVRSRQVAGGYEAFRNELLRNTQITSVAASSDLPGDPLYSNGSVIAKEISDEPINVFMMTCDYDYVDTYRMEMIAGRNFSRQFSTDTVGTMILNEAAAKRIGWTPEEAVGKLLYRGDGITTKIVGVVNDFNYKSLHTLVEPAILYLIPNYITAVSVRILSGNIQETLDTIEQQWQSSFPDERYEFSFLDDRLDQMYENDIKMQRIFTVFAGLSIFVACLGLFGLAAYTAEVRTKEIGIRKTLGASISSVLVLLTRQFTRWVIIGSIIAWPIAFYAMNRWLQNFAYKTPLGIWIFIASTTISLLVAILTVSVQSTKAARANPVDSLRYE